MRWSQYFSGDSTEVFSNNVKLDNGNYQIAGRTFSDTFIAGNDTLFNLGNAQRYFIYEFKDPIKTLASKSNRYTESLLKMYPNRCENYFEILLKEVEPIGLKLKILTIEGVKIREQELFSNSSLINSENLPHSIYFIQIFNNDNKMLGIQKILKL